MDGSQKSSDERFENLKKREVVFDSDIPEFTEEQLAEFHPVNPEYFRITPKKQTICIKIDSDVLCALKAEGKGYQTRINAILRKAVIG